MSEILNGNNGGELKIGVWGDSLLLGVILDDTGGKYRILKENAVTLCSRALSATIENFSKFGCTVLKGKQRLEKSLNLGKRCNIAVLEYGGNDCDMPWAEISAEPSLNHEAKTPLGTFTAVLSEMIELLKSSGAKPVLTTLPPLHHERYLSWICRDGLSRENILSFLGDSHRIYRHHERYSLAITRLAIEHGCPLVDVRAAFLEKADPGGYLCLDGIHPNEKGQQLIREAFVAFAGKHTPHLINGEV